MKDEYRIHPMTTEYARKIAAWTYDGAYAVYSFQPDRETIEELMNGDYLYCTGKDDQLAGYFCFGASAKIPATETASYPDGFLDIGLGMNPRLCGQGRGAAFLAAGMAYARNAFPPAPLRLTVAAFNKRAICVYRKLGFEISATLTHRNSRNPFYLMIYTGSSADSSPSRAVKDEHEQYRESNTKS